MPKRKTNKRYTAEFKQTVVEAVLKDGLSYREAEKIYEVSGYGRIQSWERIYLAEGPEGLAVERAPWSWRHRWSQEDAQNSRGRFVG